MLSEKRLLNEANAYFLDKAYDKALFIYSQLSSAFPQNQEYPIYAMLCDLTSEDESKAISLFDYFAVAKDQGIG